MTAKLTITNRELLEGMSERLAGIEQFVNALSDHYIESLKHQRKLAEHVERLVREKEILLAREHRRELEAANRFIGQPFKARG